MSIVLQPVRRINNDLAARLNIFQNRDHLVFRDRNASAGRTVCTAVQENGGTDTRGAAWVVVERQNVMIGWFDLNDVLRRILGFQRCLRRDELIVVSGIYIIDPVIRIIHLGIGKFRSGIRENAEGIRKAELSARCFAVPFGSFAYTAVSDIAACTKILVPGAVRIFRYHGHCHTGAARTFLFIFKSPLHAEMFFTETVPPSYRSGFRLRKTSPHIPSLHFLLREPHRGADRM